VLWIRDILPFGTDPNPRIRASESDQLIRILLFLFLTMTTLLNSNKNPLPLCRVYGLGTEAIIDRAAELENMQQLAARGV
jgi:hypothetical protein